MPDLADVLAKALASPARSRFHAITMGLSFIERAKKTVEGIESRSGEGQLLLASVRWRGEEVKSLLRSAPPGMDGTGKDVGKTRREVDLWLRRVGKAFRDHRDFAMPILEIEVERILTALEAEVHDQDMLRWKFEVPEETDMLRFQYLSVQDGIRFLKELGADVRDHKRRLKAFEAAIIPYLSTMKDVSA